jgi:hypothetical protein
VDHKCFIWNDIMGQVAAGGRWNPAQVVELSDSERQADPMERQQASRSGQAGVHVVSRSAVSSRAGRLVKVRGPAVCHEIGEWDTCHRDTPCHRLMWPRSGRTP